MQSEEWYNRNMHVNEEILNKSILKAVVDSISFDTVMGWT
jgi:hypothetical protein